MIRPYYVSKPATVSAFAAASLFASAAVAEDVTTDIGTLDKATAEKAFPAKPPYSPYAGRNFPITAEQQKIEQLTDKLEGQ
jgi:hypothetical protein